jgi:hypothetical protein
LKYELQTRVRAAFGEPERKWAICESSNSLSRLQREQRKAVNAVGGQFAGEPEYRVVEVKRETVPEARPTIEEKHAAELRDLEEREKRWARKAKRAATELKKIRRRKRRLERLYAPRSEPA